MPKSKTVEHGPSIGEMTTTSSNSLPANRAETGRFVPGQSGNPSGRPKRDENLAALAREVLLTATAQNLRRLAKLIWRPPQPIANARVA